MKSNLPLRILVAYSQPIVGEGISAILTQQSDMCVVGQAACGHETIVLFSQHQPDVLVMEWGFSDMDGKTVISTLKARFPTAHILVLSRHEDEETIFTALQAGARGYFPEDVQGETLAAGVRAVCAGNTAVDETIAQKMAARISKPELTSREREVLQQVVTGKSNLEIAEVLFVSVGTVKSHLNKIFAKLEVSDRTQAVLVAIKRGLAKLT